jgi:hypothetical protein
MGVLFNVAGRHLLTHFAIFIFCIDYLLVNHPEDNKFLGV